MTSAYVTVLVLHICFIDVETQKINGFTLLTHGIVLTNSQLEDKQKRLWFFQKIFLVANTTIEVVLRMLFLFFNKMEINFAD